MNYYKGLLTCPVYEGFITGIHTEPDNKHFHRVSTSTQVFLTAVELAKANIFFLEEPCLVFVIWAANQLRLL